MKAWVESLSLVTLDHPDPFGCAPGYYENTASPPEPAPSLRGMTFQIQRPQRSKRFGFKNRNFGGFSPGQRSQKPFLDYGGQGCCIISN